MHTGSFPPEFLARYRIHSVLGSGAMGSVLLATQLALDRRVAIKCLHRLDESMLRRFQREAELTAALSHPNIVRLYLCDAVGELPFLVYEYVEGASLRTVLKDRGARPADEVAALAAQLYAGLAFAHERGIAHRDVKPDNLLLGPDGTLKIADFGIASSEALLPSLTATGQAVGSPAYMPPEQWDGMAGPPADVYAAGVTLHEMWTGHNPYAGSSMAAIRMAHEHAELPRRGGEAGAPLEELIRRATAKRAADRPAAAELARMAARMSLTPISSPSVEARRAPVAGVAMAVVATFFVAISFPFQRVFSPPPSHAPAPPASPAHAALLRAAGLRLGTPRGPLAADRRAFARALADAARGGGKTPLAEAKARDLLTAWTRARFDVGYSELLAACRGALAGDEKWTACAVLDGCAVLELMASAYTGAPAGDALAARAALIPVDHPERLARPAGARALSARVAPAVRRIVQRDTLSLWTHRSEKIPPEFFTLASTQVKESWDLPAAAGDAEGWMRVDAGPAPQGPARLCIKTLNLTGERVLWVRLASGRRFGVFGQRRLDGGAYVAPADRAARARATRLAVPVDASELARLELIADEYDRNWPDRPFPSEVFVTDVWLEDMR